MSDYIITIEDWFFRYAHERYTHFFGCPIEEIVRCRDCAYYEDYIGRCVRRYHPMAVTPDGFCAWGEREGDGQAQ